jgi:hypothetical protein
VLPIASWVSASGKPKKDHRVFEWCLVTWVAVAVLDVSLWLALRQKQTAAISWDGV